MPKQQINRTNTICKKCGKPIRSFMLY
eukprot:SAG31_NODE_39505_length_287_cov_1.510638_1_plen_26_part_01